MHFNLDDSFKWCTPVSILRAVLIRKREWANKLNKTKQTHLFIIQKKIPTAIQFTEMYILHMRAENWA